MARGSVVSLNLKSSTKYLAQSCMGCTPTAAFGNDYNLSCRRRLGRSRIFGYYPRRMLMLKGAHKEETKPVDCEI